MTPTGAMGNESAAALPDLPQMSLATLRALWRRLFRASQPTISRDLMIRGLAYRRLQEQSLGGLTKTTQRKLRALQQEFASQGDITAPIAVSIKPGSRLVREWHGKPHVVTVTEAGFAYAGQTYRSLTRIAHHITGAHWSGPRFFGLTSPMPNQRRTSDMASSAKAAEASQEQGARP